MGRGAGALYCGKRLGCIEEEINAEVRGRRGAELLQHTSAGRTGAEGRGHAGVPSVVQAGIGIGGEFGEGSLPHRR
ncbi:MAG: hypothetical protein M5R42_04340 [Rhodocyclaceae bacterium]|nr:hypothetical protein [Rhodocyclaceae bacterium]